MNEKILPKQIYDTGKINAGEITMECYHLDNGKRVISKRGIQKALGIPKEKSGQELQQSLAIYKQSKNCPSNIIDILYHFENNGIDFIRKGAGGSQPKTSGFEDEFFIDICHFIQDLNILGLLRPEHQFLYYYANIIERAFSKLGIRAYIDEATGYIRHKKEREYADAFDKFLLEEAGDWAPMFKREFFGIIWKVWLNKKQPDNNKRQPFFGNIIRKYVYKHLAISKLGYDQDAVGVLLKELDKKNPHRKVRHHQFLNDIGKDVLKEHLTKFITIGEMSNDKRQFDSNFAKVFKVEKPQSEFEFFENE